jgi:predicted nucleic acid-binding protein
VGLILDTNAVSAFADADLDILGPLKSAERLSVPVIVLGEYRLGIAQSRYREGYESWLSGWMSSVSVLEVNQETADHYSSIGLELKKKGTPIPTNDLWIAALCRQHGLPLLSRDRHFDHVPRLQRLSW